MNTRIRDKARFVLQKYGDMGTDILVQHINDLVKHGTTASELGNILCRSPEFEKIERERRQSVTGQSGGSYLVCRWHLQMIKEVSSFSIPQDTTLLGQGKRQQS